MLGRESSFLVGREHELLEEFNQHAVVKLKRSLRGHFDYLLQAFVICFLAFTLLCLFLGTGFLLDLLGNVADLLTQESFILSS